MSALSVMDWKRRVTKQSIIRARRSVPATQVSSGQVHYVTTSRSRCWTIAAKTLLHFHRHPLLCRSAPRFRYGARLTIDVIGEGAKSRTVSLHPRRPMHRPCSLDRTCHGSISERKPSSCYLGSWKHAQEHPTCARRKRLVQWSNSLPVQRGHEKGLCIALEQEYPISPCCM